MGVVVAVVVVVVVVVVCVCVCVCLRSTAWRCHKGEGDPTNLDDLASVTFAYGSACPFCVHCS